MTEIPPQSCSSRGQVEPTARAVDAALAPGAGARQTRARDRAPARFSGAHRAPITTELNG